MKRTILILVATLMLLGCSAISLKPGAEKVLITDTKPADGCKFLGEVVGNQGNFFTGRYTSNENLEIGAQNNLKNKAMEMGGNVIVLLTQRAGQTTGMYGAGSETNVTVSGNVYKCP